MEVGEALERVVGALPGGGERRLGQQQMADAVATAIEKGRHVVIQAPTGVGKSVAYLVPAILSGKKVVVATATKALQDQLAGKDLPLLTQHLGHKFTFAVLKGRSNYFCKQRAVESTGADDQLGLDESDVAEDATATGRQVVRLVDWSRTTETGDRADLDFEPTPRAWGAVSVNAMECPGALRCPSGEECFAEAARQRAEGADVIVVNSHLYGAHLASGRNVIPAHDVVIFDEAHELEDIASSSLGLELTAGRFRAMAFNLRRLINENAALPIFDLAGRFDAAFDPARGERLLQGREDVERFLDMAGQRVRDASAELRKVEADDPAKARSLQAAGHLAGDIDFVRNATSGQVVWVEGAAGAPVVKIAPIDVGSELTAKLWDFHDEDTEPPTAVLTSATIPAGLGVRLGLDTEDFDELDVGSPFDFEENGLLYCAAHLPEPRAPGYEAAMHDELTALINAAGGRTLALFTSWRAMHAAAAEVASRVEYRILTQADLPKPALLRAFSADDETCLFATMGFWQGVDVPGTALSQVVIDKIPFPRPDEPLLQARRERAGPAAFRIIDLPRAATLLAQGAGRLIRSHTDRGVVAILDSRLAKATYRWDLVNALPPMRRTRQLDDVRAFFSVGQ